MDPLGIEEPGRPDLNLYAYVGGRALIATDPTGTEGLLSDLWTGVKVAFGGRDEEAARAGKAAGEAAVRSSVATNAMMQSEGAGQAAAAVSKAGSKVNVTSEESAEPTEDELVEYAIEQGYLQAGDAAGEQTFRDMLRGEAADGAELPDAGPGLTSEEAWQALEPLLTASSARAEGSRTVLVYGDGSEEVRRGGTRAWRNNNPGNLRNSEFSQDQGSLGEAGGFAVFRNEDSGQTALLNLLNTNTYQQLTVNEAISRFAPPKENDTASYQRAIREGLGVDGATELSNLTPEQIQALSAIIRGVEGWTPGTVIRR